MAKFQSFKYTLCLTCSIILNLFFAKVFLRVGWEQSWTKMAAKEAETVASISCSGHGRAFLDGLVVNGKPICECNACFAGPDCSDFLPECVVDADR